MSIYGAHLVAESLGDSLDHVEDVGADCTDGGDLLADSEPLAHAEHVLSDALELHVEVTEVADEGSSGSGDADNTVFNRECHSLGEGYSIVGLDQLHDPSGLPAK